MKMNQLPYAGPFNDECRASVARAISRCQAAAQANAGGKSIYALKLKTMFTAAATALDSILIALITPGVPTIGVATAASGTSVSVAFTAGSPAGTSYVATSTPGSFTATGASSPLVVSGLDTETAYTFTVHAVNTGGNSAESAASNSVTP